MNFDFTTEQEMIRRTIKEFAEKEVAPGAMKRDETGEFPVDIFKKLSSLGMMGLPFPEEYGGAGADMISFAIVTEELSKACASTGITYSAHISLGCAPLHLFGTKAQKEKYLVPLCTGESLGAFALTEPNAGSDAGGTATTAIEENGEYVINGSKCFITNASYAKHLALTAVTGKKGKSKEISAIIVPTDAKGFSIQAQYKKMGLRASNTTELHFDNVHVPTENLLGKKGEGFKQFLITLDGGRIGIGAMAVGIAQAAYEKALAYVKERKQFGQTLSKFQAIQFKLADMAMKIDLARTYVYKAAWLKDHGRPFTKEAAICKLYASEICMEVATQAIQIHGGYGYMRDFEVERYLRDGKLTEIGEGTSEIQRMVIARQLGL